MSDLSVQIIPPSESRPGFEATYTVLLDNKGSTALSGTLQLDYDNLMLEYLEADSDFVSGSSESTITLAYTIPSFSTQQYKAHFRIFPPPTVNIYEVLEFTASAGNIENDQTPQDNITSLSQVVVGSYDPNDKQVQDQNSFNNSQREDYSHHIEQTQLGDYIQYLIRFQNTGTASAINVRVKDILDANLDWETFEPISYSHELTRLEITDQHILEFYFDDINLPDSTTDEPNSHGYISFRIKPLSTLEIGDAIEAQAEIYFDYNLPIITNTVTTTIVAEPEDEVLSINEFNLWHKGIPVKLVTNPIEDSIHLTSSEFMKSYIVYNMNGSTLLEGNFDKLMKEVYIPASDLSQGVYFIKVLLDNNTFVHIKCVKLGNI